MIDNAIARQYACLRNTLEQHLEPLGISVVSILIGETAEAYEGATDWRDPQATSEGHNAEAERITELTDLDVPDWYPPPPESPPPQHIQPLG